jgi:hypothetical protein
MPVQTGVPQATAYVGTTTTTTVNVIKPANGVLFTLSITAIGTGPGLAIYDNTTNSGNVLYASTTAPVAGTVILFNSPFQTGLTIASINTIVAVSYT